MSTAKTGELVTEEKDKNERLVKVSIPVTVTIAVPIEIELSIPDAAIVHSNELDCNLVDALECPDAANIVVAAAMESEAAGKAFDGMVAAALRFKEMHPDVDIYATPYAGLIKERKL